MIVEKIMHTTLYTLQPNNTIKDAIELMRKKSIRHIPIVTEDFALVGVVTAHDIKNAMPSSISDEPPSGVHDVVLASIMTTNPIIGHPLDFIEEIANTMYDAKISCVPIVSKGKLIGILTTTDLLYAFIELTGSNKPSSKIDIRVTDEPGILNEITDIFKEHHANILSILIYPDTEDVNKRILSIRLQIINPLTIIEHLKTQGYDVLWPTIPGMIV